MDKGATIPAPTSRFHPASISCSGDPLSRRDFAGRLASRRHLLSSRIAAANRGAATSASERSEMDSRRVFFAHADRLFVRRPHEERRPELIQVQDVCGGSLTEGHRRSFPMSTPRSRSASRMSPVAVRAERSKLSRMFPRRCMLSMSELRRDVHARGGRRGLLRRGRGRWRCF